MANLFRGFVILLRIAVFDWDGTIVNTMDAHADLAAECISQCFGMSFVEARKHYLATTGIPFDKQLEKIFPGKEFEDARKACAKSYHGLKGICVYGDPKMFPGIPDIIDHGRKEEIPIMISSSTEEAVIKKWADDHGLFFSAIFGRESGTKKDHIELLRELYSGNDVRIVFFSDSSGDMSVPADAKCGVCVPIEEEKSFFEKGATIITLNPPNIDFFKIAI